ncbi:hypothetical protein A3K86_10845 [Photobacterium jeanii]|uniref:Uncharacterized protein n=2 Tax=Photobacterium jeanii TaxID=858640 RepID=A0A178KIC3_9GAMM|nr:hypothetical protein A3K86_10845 [Photobacterium jeanii]PST85922.1 hypothetical protein C9I91_22325 [Photobacterium jeanii]
MNSRQRLELKRRRSRKLKLYWHKRNELDAFRIRFEKATEDYLAKRKLMVRRHADFFETPDKTTKELFVTQSLFQMLEAETKEYLVSMSLAQDPPDVAVSINTGKKIGVEVTELVNEKAIGLDIKRKRIQYIKEIISWNYETFTLKLQNIISTKAKKCEQLPAGYDELVLLIFTDEPRLDATTIEEYIKDTMFSDIEAFQSVYILTSHDPKRQGKGLLKVGT